MNKINTILLAIIAAALVYPIAERHVIQWQEARELEQLQRERQKPKFVLEY